MPKKPLQSAHAHLTQERTLRAAAAAPQAQRQSRCFRGPIAGCCIRSPRDNNASAYIQLVSSAWHSRSVPRSPGERFWRAPLRVPTRTHTARGPYPLGSQLGLKPQHSSHSFSGRAGTRVAGWDVVAVSRVALTLCHSRRTSERPLRAVTERCRSEFALYTRLSHTHKRCLFLRGCVCAIALGVCRMGVHISPNPVI